MSPDKNAILALFKYIFIFGIFGISFGFCKLKFHLKGRVRHFWKPILIFEITKTNTPLPQKGIAPILIDLTHIYTEVGRVSKNCTQVKVKLLIEIFTQVIVWIVTWVRVKKYRIKKLLK